MDIGIKEYFEKYRKVVINLDAIPPNGVNEKEWQKAVNYGKMLEKGIKIYLPEVKDIIHLYYGVKCVIVKKNTQFKVIGNVGDIVEINGSVVTCVQNGIIEVKLILRKLDSFTEEEDMKLFPEYNQGLYIDQHWHATGFLFLLIKGFDIFNLIEDGKAIDINTIKDESDTN